MTAAEKRSIPTADEVQRVLLSAMELEDLTESERGRIVADMTDPIVEALVHGATFEDVSADLHSFLTVTYGMTASPDDCAELARQLIRLTSSAVER